MEKVQLSQNEFCEVMGITYQTLWKWDKTNIMPKETEIIKLPSGRKRVLISRDYPGVQDVLNKRS